MIRLRPSGADEVLIKRVRDWYEPGPGVFIAPQALFNPALLFTSGVNGTWYDPSDLNTLYQDAAGTTPVTAVEQPVGLMKDKSGRGNHAFNSSGNSANFPVLSARYNLLTKTEQFDDAVWKKLTAGTAVAIVTPNYGTAPDGTQTATRVQLDRGDSYSILFQEFTTAANLSVLDTAYIKTTDGSTKTISFGHSDVGPVVITVTDSWQKFSQTASSAGTIRYIEFATRIGTSQAADILIWHPDARVANDALNQPTYQRVNTATDYDTAGFKPYLKFNGTNQWLQTNSIDFTYGDKMFVSAGVRKLSDAATGTIVDFNATVGTNAFMVRAPSGALANCGYWSGGNVALGGAAISNNSFASPITNVLSGVGDISGDSTILRVNGTQAAISTADQGTGNYGNYPLYIGARAGSSLFFNGRLHQLIVAGKQASDSEITSTENYLNQKTGAY